MKTINLSRSNFIHLLRWLSAYLVVFNHLRAFIFKDFPLLKHTSPFIKFFYLLTSLGNQSVVVFFVLSGYLVAGSIIRQIKQRKFDIKEYAIKRVSRLYAVLFFALLLTLVLDHTGIYFDKIGLYTGKLNLPTLTYAITSHLSLKYFLASLFMLQTIVLPPLGSNNPLWSLANEFWYYVLFPCFAMLIFYTGTKTKHIMMYVFVLILLLIFLPLGIKLAFFIWLMGLIPFYITLKGGFYKLFFLILFVAWLAVKKFIHIDDLPYNLILGLLIALWVASYPDCDQPAGNRLLKLNEKLSSFSYSTYLVHFPIIMLVLTLIRNYSLTGIWIEPSLKGYIIFTCVFLFVIVCSYFVATFTEFRTPQFREYLKRIFSRRKSVPALLRTEGQEPFQ